jgi:hypothetical protein
VNFRGAIYRCAPRRLPHQSVAGSHANPKVRNHELGAE